MVEHNIRWLVQIDDALYSVSRESQGWVLLQLMGKREGAVYRTGPGWCSCPDATYRHTECKHQQALRDLLAGGATNALDGSGATAG